ncbi:hypothetical protein LIT32_25810 (plasmid) [Bacillus sp. CMF21]|nr:hypothetical protein LIT32_25810 [Bacillus sp. CMF21]
MRLRFPSLNQ